MIEKRKILFVCMLFAAKCSFCQCSTSAGTAILKKQGSVNLFPFSKFAVSPAILPANFSINEYGFFCKKELKFEAATKIPLKFRLGNVQYCDWLEGKKNAGTLLR